jgi:kynurenine formamidase
VRPARSEPGETLRAKWTKPTIGKQSAAGPAGKLFSDLAPAWQFGGEACVIDCKDLLGTTDRKDWPASPEIAPAHIKEYESRQGELRPGEVVIFFSGWSDQYLKPFPEGNACMADPLNGKREGWPAPGPDAIGYLAEKGICCVATDGPARGGVEPRRALWTYWALGGKGMAGVEFLTGIGQIEDKKAYFLFAAVKTRGCHGGPGRAIALY